MPGESEKSRSSKKVKKGKKGNADEWQEGLSSKGVVSEDMAIHTCHICKKTFFSVKGLHGHMGCHAERPSRGMAPPEKSRRRIRLGSCSKDHVAARCSAPASCSGSARNQRSILISWPSEAKRRRSFSACSFVAASCCPGNGGDRYNTLPTSSTNAIRVSEVSPQSNKNIKFHENGGSNSSAGTKIASKRKYDYHPVKCCHSEVSLQSNKAARIYENGGSSSSAGKKMLSKMEYNYDYGAAKCSHSSARNALAGADPVVALSVADAVVTDQTRAALADDQLPLAPIIRSFDLNELPGDI